MKLRPQGLSFETLEARHVLAASPIITEFMASNDGALLDGYGAENDWVELYNPSDQSIDLQGFSLTDNPDELDRWTFPSVALAPGQFLVVFASGRDEVDPAGNLHTNFSLSAGGEYLALVSPQGTVLSQYGTEDDNFPAQDSNASYGIGFSSETRQAINGGSSASYLIPTDGSVDASWMLPDFDDTGWSAGTASLGYQATTGPYSGLYQTTLPVGTHSTYVRIPFTVDSMEEVAGTLRMKYDDGFVVYLNGVEIIRKNAPTSVTYDSSATEFRPREAAIIEQVFSINTEGLLELGENVLAIHVLNSDASTIDDLLLAPSLSLSKGTPLSPERVGSMITPTPGAPNTNVRAADVEFSHIGGVFTAPFALTLTSTGLNEQIRYTLNGTEPNVNSSLYVGPISITASIQVRAKAFGAEGQIGKVRTEAYTAVTTEWSDFSSNLPIIVLENFGTGVPGREFKNARIAVYDVDSSTGRSSFNDAATLTSLVGQHRRGSSSYNQPKYNLRIEFRDESGQDRDVDLLGMPAESDWILYAPLNYDRSMLRNAVMFDLGGQFDDYAIRTRFVEVFANTDGGSLDANDYMGVYVLMENIKSDENRVVIDNLTPADVSEPNITGGYIIKVDRADAEEDSSWDVRGTPQPLSMLVHVDPERSEMTQAQTDYIRGYISDFEAALYGPNWLNPETGYTAYLDVDSFIDHHLMRAFSREKDSVSLSEHYYKPRDGKLMAGPGWDFDRSAASEGALQLSAEGWQVTDGGVLKIFNWGWWGRLFDDHNFTQKWIDRWQELRHTVFSDENLTAVVLNYAAEIDEAQVRNAARWPDYAPNGGQYADPELTGWDAEVSHFINWMHARAAWMDQQMVAPASIQYDVSSEVTLYSDNPSATLYYTLDGSDPRANGGGISPAAIVYTEPFIAPEGALINVRAYGVAISPLTRWSRLETAAPSQDQTYPLRIVELMYNPPGSEDDTEYFELLNTGTYTIELAGVRITEFSGGGFTFTSGSLAPGERIIAVKNHGAFAAAYPDVTNVASGVFSGSLANEGELVGLLDPQGNVIQWFVYGDSNIPGWPELPDGEGYSLEYVGPLNAGENPLNGSPEDPFDNPINWRASLQEGGSPGASGEPVVPESGDFDGDGDVDGRDFLAWQRGFGSTNATKAQGDANNDQVVNQADLAIWQTQYGTVALASVVDTQETPFATSSAPTETTASSLTDTNGVAFWLPAVPVAANSTNNEVEVLLPEYAEQPADAALADFGSLNAKSVADFGDIAVCRGETADATDVDDALGEFATGLTRV